MQALWIYTWAHHEKKMRHSPFVKSAS
jgi:hypothetical protein